MMQQIYERLARIETETKAQTKILTEICRTQKTAERRANLHELSDEHRFTALETAHKKDKIDRWATKAAMVAGAAILHFLHLK